MTHHQCSKCRYVIMPGDLNPQLIKSHKTCGGKFVPITVAQLKEFFGDQS